MNLNHLIGAFFLFCIGAGIIIIIINNLLKPKKQYLKNTYSDSLGYDTIDVKVYAYNEIITNGEWAEARFVYCDGGEKKALICELHLKKGSYDHRPDKVLFSYSYDNLDIMRSAFKIMPIEKKYFYRCLQTSFIFYTKRLKTKLI